MAFTKGKGTLLRVKFDDATPTTITQRFTVDIDFGENETIDVTHLDSTSREIIPSGFNSTGEVNLSVWLDGDDATHTALFDWWKTPDDHPVVIVLADTGATQYDFSAICTGFSMTGIETSGAIQADITLQITGDVLKS